jgi:hypothetical protein
MLVLLAACGARNTPPPITVPPPQETAARAEARRARVETLDRAGQRSPLAPLQERNLAVGEGVDVDETGSAVLKFADLLLLEVLRDGELQVRQFVQDESSALIDFGLATGVVVGDFNPQQEINRRLTITTEFARIEVAGTQYLLARERETPLWWLVVLDAQPDQLRVTADGVTKAVVTGQARWVAPIGEPSPGIGAQMEGVQGWLDSARAGRGQPELGEVLWPQADVLANTEPLAELPPPGQPFTLEGVVLTLDPEGLFGAPAYALEDCNGDGIGDIAMVGGRLHFDFRPVLARVRALDVTVWNRSGPGQGQLIVYDPARNPMNKEVVTVGAGQTEVIALRSQPGRPYHYAGLDLADGCFLGFSLTPPEMDGSPGAPRPAVTMVTPVPTPIPPAIATPTPTPSPQCRAVADELNLREGPGLEYGSLAVIGRGTPLEPLARRDDGSWLLVAVPDIGKGWVRNAERFVACNFDTSLLPVEKAPPTPTPTVTPPPATPTVTPTPPNTRPEEQGLMWALPLGTVGGYPVEIILDGSYKDWLTLSDLSGVKPTLVDQVVFDRACKALFSPNYGPEDDLFAVVWFAYDDNYLYTAFVVQDEGFVPYTGPDLRFFLGDAPQLLLDTDLPGDYHDTGLNADDLQIDFHPGWPQRDLPPRAVLWQLSTQRPRELTEAVVAVGPRVGLFWRGELGYFLEAAVPWKALGVVPKPGLTLGLVASVSDNDTANTNNQECMISTDPRRNWRDPTTWGTLILIEPGPF